MTEARTGDQAGATVNETAPLSSLRAIGRGGLTVGVHSFGAAPIANLAHAVTDDEAFDALEAAWAAGVRYYDVAPHYGVGLGERRLGQFLGSKPRSEFIVSTKVGRLLVEDSRGARPDDQGFAVSSSLVRRWDFSSDGIRRSLDESLDRLGLDRIDIVYVHDPDDFHDQALDESFPTLDALRRDRTITSYGAGMNQAAMLTEFVNNTDVDVVMCAGRFTLLEQGALRDLLPAATRRNVSVVAAAVFNSGLLATDRPSPAATYDYRAVPARLLARANALADVCARHGVSLPAAAVQFPLHHPAVATVCIGARSYEQVTRNARLFSEAIPRSLWAELEDLGLIDVLSAPHPTEDEG